MSGKRSLFLFFFFSFFFHLQSRVWSLSVVSPAVWWIQLKIGLSPCSSCSADLPRWPDTGLQTEEGSVRGDVWTRLPCYAVLNHPMVPVPHLQCSASLRRHLHTWRCCTRTHAANIPKIMAEKINELRKIHLSVQNTPRVRFELERLLCHWKHNSPCLCDFPAVL